MPMIQRRALLLGATGLALSAGEAAARAGVVAVVVRDPAVGANGALNSGLDIQPGQTIATQPGELVNLLFVDGTSLTLGPKSVLRIDRCTFDSASGKGDLALSLQSGQFHFIGGEIGRTGEIALSTPAGSVFARDAIVTFSIVESVAIALLADGTARKVDAPVSSAALAAPGDECDRPVAELLIVISILGVMAALALPGIEAALQKAYTTGQLSNMKQLWLANAHTVPGTIAVKIELAFERLSSVSEPLVSLGAKGAAPGMSETIDREMANPRVALRLKERYIASKNGSLGARPPQASVVQKISSHITNRPYQTTFPPKQ